MFGGEGVAALAFYRVTKRVLFCVSLVFFRVGKVCLLLFFFSLYIPCNEVGELLFSRVYGVGFFFFLQKISSSAVKTKFAGRRLRPALTVDVL